jgi:hypothetical protein
MMNLAIKRIYQDLSQQAAEHEGTATRADLADPPAARRPLRNILWIDLNHERTTYERDELGTLFAVSTASTEEAALAALDNADVDAVVIAQPRRGLDVTRFVSRGGGRPVVVYAPEETAATATGTIAVTSYSDLVRTLRRLARTYFDALVKRQLAEVGAVVTPAGSDIDYVVELPSRKKVAVETPHWLRTPKPESLKQRFDKLATAVQTGDVQAAVLVTQIPRRIGRRAALAPRPDGVQLVELDRLGDTLRRLA